MALRVAEAIPDCVGMSVCHFDADITFTLVTTSERLRMLDAAQYLDGGPCQVAALDGDEVSVDDLLDEGRWQLLALASAAEGVKSSLSLPLRHSGQLYGSANFYANTTHGFQGKERDLARIVWRRGGGCGRQRRPVDDVHRPRSASSRTARRLRQHSAGGGRTDRQRRRIR